MKLNVLRHSRVASEETVAKPIISVPFSCRDPIGCALHRDFIEVSFAHCGIPNTTPTA